MNSINNTLFIGKVLLSFQSVSSTNEEAQNIIIKNNAKNGMVIFAYEQRAGKGNFGSKWHTQSGQNIIMSIIFFPAFILVQDQFYYNMSMALGVYDFFKKYLPHPTLRIKWPNDIYYHNYKLGGILIENSINGRNIHSSVVGIGLNINQEKFPEDLPNPGSLKAITGRDYDLQVLMEELCGTIEVRYLELRAYKNNKIKIDYENALFRHYEEHTYKDSQGLFSGKIKGITHQGKLIVETGAGEKEYGFKEIEFLI